MITKIHDLIEDVTNIDVTRQQVKMFCVLIGGIVLFVIVFLFQMNSGPKSDDADMVVQPPSQTAPAHFNK